MSGANATTSGEITLPTSLRGKGGYAVFIYAIEYEFESIIDFVAALDDVEIAISKTDPGTTMINLNDSQCIDKVWLEISEVGTGASGHVTDKIIKHSFIRPIVLAGEKIYMVVGSTGLAAAVVANVRFHYQLKWVNAQVFNRSLLQNV